MLGFKSFRNAAVTISGIELTHRQIPGYWEPRGYDIDGRIDQ